jgi:hypothetical protein
MLRCAQVTVIPEDINITVFKKGNPKKSKSQKPFSRGHLPPTHIDGTKVK